MKRLTIPFLAASLLSMSACDAPDLYCVIDDVPPGVEIGTCDDLRQDFEPCGGDPRGAWEFADVCVDPAELGFHFWESWCPAAPSETFLDIAGRVDISDTKFSYGDITLTFEGAVYFEPRCLTDAGYWYCSDVIDFVFVDADYAECVELDGGCDCYFSYTSYSDPASYDYSIEGNDLVVRGLGGDEVYPYCVGTNDRMAMDLSVYLGIPDTFYIFDRRY